MEEYTGSSAQFNYSPKTKAPLIVSGASQPPGKRGGFLSYGQIISVRGEMAGW